MLLCEDETPTIFDEQNTGWRVLVSNEEGIVVSQSIYLDCQEMNCLKLVPSNQGFYLRETLGCSYTFSREVIEDADILFVDPDAALKLDPQGELRNLVQTMKRSMLPQLCFILREYAKWLKVEVEASSLGHLTRKNFANAWEYIIAVEDNREDMEEWIEDTVRRILK